MKVLIVNTSESSGGAAVAAKRLMSALNRNGIEARMLVRDKTSDDDRVVSIDATACRKRLSRLRFLRERLTIFLRNRLDRKTLFQISIANSGTDISRHPLVREADIIHLHWINQGYLSLADIRRLCSLGKPIVWTMHDMWPCTGICHHARECEAYSFDCRQCPFLKSSCNRMARNVLLHKEKVWKKAGISFVACSDWLRRRASVSRLTQGHTLVNIPNPIDTGFFVPAETASPSDDRKIRILFGAAKASDKRKGIDYFVEACRLLSEQIPADSLTVVCYGKGSEELSPLIPFEVESLGYISGMETIRDLYRSVDMFVIPSLEENLPNTIMEAMACGVPCVGFKIGGIPEMIDHLKNGYVARYKSAEDLAAGIQWVVDNNRDGHLSAAARRKVLDCYCGSQVAARYTALYESLLEKD